MVRTAERFRQIIGKNEVGLPRFSSTERTHVLESAKQFVAEAKHMAPESGVDGTLFAAWVPKTTDFAKPEKLGENIHAHHNLRHTAAVVGEEMFLVPYVEAAYADRLSHRQLLHNAAYAGAAGHDLLRTHDVWGAIPESWYKIHGEQMAEAVRSGERFPNLSPLERTVAATGIQYHDVDHRKPSARNPEDELLAIVDRGELVRLIHGVGIIATGVQKAEGITRGNRFAKQQQYDSYYFPGLAEKIKPLSQAVLILSLEGMKKGLTQAESVWYAMQELGMTKELANEKPAA